MDYSDNSPDEIEQRENESGLECTSWFACNHQQIKEEEKNGEE